ncbi:hypothetical protein PPROV_000445200 [Pycnococcus provasolii]|uniref:MYND-type domain-containing protein n=1 Tax=Pycnococcus provasolii TaxID=41880 RepID=A0A830HG25_9CHLO|nr:hypothetical protein PPROV_000445200 [Pycnococcus provasolii]
MPLEQAYRTLLISSQLESHATEMNNVTQVKYDKMIKRLHESLDRMESHGTWKMWKCTLNEDLESPPIFHTSEELRNHLTTNHNLNLQPVKPGRPPTPAETALRERMANLLETVADDARQVEEVIKTRDRQRRIPQKKLTEWARQRTITKICTILDHMHHEEQCLFDSCLLPVLRFVNDNIPDGVERQSTSTQIVYADLKLLSTNSLERCEEYLLDRVEGYAAELNKPRDPNDGDIKDLQVLEEPDTAPQPEPSPPTQEEAHPPPTMEDLLAQQASQIVDLKREVRMLSSMVARNCMSPSMVARNCMWCGKTPSEAKYEGTHLRSCKCDAARYCSSECQSNDWRTHKRVCLYHHEKRKKKSSDRWVTHSSDVEKVQNLLGEA